MTTATIDIDVFAYITGEGIGASVYLGQTSDDPIVVETPWEEVLQAELDMHCIPSGPLVVSSESDGVEAVMDTVERFRSLANDLEEMVRSKEIMLRDEWVKGTKGPDRDPYIVTYGEYLDYIVTGEVK